MKVPLTILITGAANGIGRATAEALAERGHRVGLIDRDAERLLDLERQSEHRGRHVEARVADVTEPEPLRQAIEEIEARLGPTDTLLACAGIGRLTLVPDLDVATLQETLEVNLIGVARTIEVVLPGMIQRGDGHILGVSSLAGYRGFPWMISYSASKAGLIAYLEAIRPGLSRRGVRVTTVCPGFVRTAMSTDIPYKRPIRMLEPEHAARHLVRAVERRPRNSVFPFRMRFGMALLKHMPDRLFDWLMRQAGPEALNVEF